MPIYIYIMFPNLALKGFRSNFNHIPQFGGFVVRGRE